MHRCDRSLAGRILGTAAVAWVLPATGLTFAQSPQPDPPPKIVWVDWQNPIASSNRLTAAPRPPEPPAVVPAPAPVLAPTGGPVPGRASLSVPPPPPAGPMPSIHWTAPNRRPVESALPVPDRPMFPCELSPSPSPVVKAPPAAGPAAVEPARPPTPSNTACRFVDDAPAKPAAADDPTIFAAVRGATASSTGGANAEALRQAVEAACGAAATDIRAEVVGLNQVRVTLTVRSQAEWQTLYAHLQSLPELGDHGILCRVRVKP
jgi:hypothetical protein